MFGAEIWSFDRPSPKLVDTICNIEKIVADIAARAIRAG
jgi:hypothetical protein